MKVERIIKLTFSEEDRDVFERAKEFLDDMLDDDYDALSGQFCTVRELYESLDDFIGFMNDNME